MFSEDGVKDINESMARPENYLTSDGGLVQPTTQVVHDHLFANFTGFPR